MTQVTEVELPEGMIETGMLPVAHFSPAPENPRVWASDDQAVKDLAESLKKGQIHPIAARPHPEWEERYEVRAGHCRLAAAQLLGWDTIRAEIFDWDDDEAFIVTMEENHSRTDLKPLEEAKLCQVAVERFDVETAAEKLGHSEKWVRRRASLNRLIDLWREALEDNEQFAGWTVGHLEVVAKLDDEFQEHLLQDLLRRAGADYPLDISGMTITDLRRDVRGKIRTLDNCPWLEQDFPPVPCTQCAKRSANSPLLPHLLSDTQEDECLDSKCFLAKAQAYFRQEVEAYVALHAEELRVSWPGWLAYEGWSEVEGEFDLKRFIEWGNVECTERDAGAIPVLRWVGFQSDLQWWKKELKDESGTGQRFIPRPKTPAEILADREHAAVDALCAQLDKIKLQDAYEAVDPERILRLVWVFGAEAEFFGDELDSSRNEEYPAPLSAGMEEASCEEICEHMFAEILTIMCDWLEKSYHSGQEGDELRAIRLEKAQLVCAELSLSWDYYVKAGIEAYPDPYAAILALPEKEAVKQLVELGKFDDRSDALTYVGAEQHGEDWRDKWPNKPLYDRSRECAAALDDERGVVREERSEG